jgi:hypothetical protein
VSLRSPACTALLASFALLVLATPVMAPCAHATDGHLRITATAAGTLELEHATGGSR